jgi:hypothetical protein
MTLSQKYDILLSKLDQLFDHFMGNKTDSVYEDIIKYNNLDRNDEDFNKKIVSMECEIIYLNVLMGKIFNLISNSRDNYYRYKDLKKELQQLKAIANESKENQQQYESLEEVYKQFKENIDILSFEEIHNLLISLDRCIAKVIPVIHSPIFMLGKVSQQLMMTAYNFSEDSSIPNSDKYKINNDALDFCFDDLSIAKELLENTTEVIIKIKKINLKNIKTKNYDENNQNEEKEDSYNGDDEYDEAEYYNRDDK